MAAPKSQSINIAPAHDKPVLSKLQKAFNALIKQSEKRRARLRAWEDTAPVFQAKYQDELVPLQQRSMELRIQLVHRLDQAYDQMALNRSERSTIAEMISSMAGDLVEESDDEDEALKALYNRHSGSDFDSEAAAGLDEMKAAFEEMFGVELGDDVDMTSPESVFEHLDAQMQQQRAEQAQEDPARKARRAKRKKTPQQLAAETRKQAEQAELSLSIRELYRKLASALHPDRETDPQERERKTELMQRVNQAYGKGSLLQLLELQLELEHFDQSDLNRISDDRLKHYNKILKEQVAELDQEILHVESEFAYRYGLPPFMALSPTTIVRELASEIHDVQRSINAFSDDLRVIENVRTLKIWLKSARRLLDAERSADRPFQDW